MIETQPVASGPAGKEQRSKPAKSCQTFEAVYQVTNLGPNPASHLFQGVGIPDAYDIEEIVGLPDTLVVGQTETVKVIIKVVAFLQREMRRAWARVNLISDYGLEPIIDPNPENNGL